MRRFTLLVLALMPIAHPAASQARRPSGSAPGGVEARFDVDGAWVNAPGALPMRVRATRFGRPGASEPVETAGPTRQGCAAPQAGCTPRVEYAGDGLTEWWRPAPGGVEQGWTVWRRPGGSGPLQIGVHAAAVASAQPGGIQLSGPAGTDGDLHVGELVAWDARGRDLPARFEPTDDGFVVVVDDADAVYPVQVDPLYTAPDWSAEGSYGYIGSGLAARAIGDVNGDGYDDVGVEGYVFFGSAAGIETDAGQDLGINAEWAFTSGDFNADGLQDLAVGSASNGGAGALDVYLGCVDADADGYCADDDCDDGDGSVPFLLYTDDDGDGFGAGSAASEGCEEGDGLVAAGTDCNDRKAEISPAAQEVCDSRGTDEDCDGLSDDDDPDVTNTADWYEDRDGDGFGTGEPVNQCTEAGALRGGDCDDDDAVRHPDRYEACDGKDNDCDDQVDEDHDCPETAEGSSTCATAPTPPAAAALLLAAALLRRRPRP